MSIVSVDILPDFSSRHIIIHDRSVKNKIRNVKDSCAKQNKREEEGKEENPKIKNKTITAPYQF